jgi:hypothetical protein
LKNGEPTLRHSASIEIQTLWLHCFTQLSHYPGISLYRQGLCQPGSAGRYPMNGQPFGFGGFFPSTAAKLACIVQPMT